MRLLRASFRKLWRRPASWVVGLILIVLIALVYLAVGASAAQVTNAQQRAQLEAFLSDETAYRTLLSFLLGLGGLLAVAYAGAVAGADWSWGTIRVSFARGENRTRYLLTTYIAIGAMVLVALLGAYAIGVGLVLLSARMAGIETGPPTGTFVGSLPELLGKAWLGLLEQAALGFAIATVARSQLAGIGAGIAVYVAEQFVQLAIPDQARYLPFTVSASLVISPEQAATTGTRLLEPTIALALTVAYLVVALLVAIGVTERAQIAN